MWGDVPWFGTSWGEGEGGGGERRKMDPVDAVDVELKLRSHAHLPSSILKCGSPIRTSILL